MALGIDQAGHKGAMDGGGLTYAVMGCGIDTCYPPSGIRLHARIREQRRHIVRIWTGCTADGIPFSIRNRIISGLSDLVLVVEARKEAAPRLRRIWRWNREKRYLRCRDGASIRSSEGCNRLIAQERGS